MSLQVCVHVLYLAGEVVTGVLQPLLCFSETGVRSECSAVSLILPPPPPSAAL